MDTKKEIVEICHRLAKNDYVSAYDGNVSILTDKNTLLITRSAINKGEVSSKDILEIDLDGNLVLGKGKPSTEWKLHSYIYKNKPGIKAVIHCHPVYSTVLATTKYGFNHKVFPEVILTLGKVPVCKYQTPSSNDLADSLKDYIEDSNAFLLENHGAVTCGLTLKDAFYKLDKLEHTSKILTYCNLLGGPKNIPNKKINELLDIANPVYGIKIDKKKIL